MIDEKELCELLLYNRNFLCALLYKAFAREPDAAFLDLLLDEATGERFALLGGEVLEKVPAFLAQLRAQEDRERFLALAREEYTRLFVGPLELSAPPWESIYTGEEGMLFQRSTLEVREFYRRFGLLPEGYPRVADDSLALELGFLSALAQRSVSAHEAGDAEALCRCLTGSRDFLTAHLLVWVPQLLERMAGAESDWLYPQLVLILDSFLKKDLDTVNRILKEGAHAHD